MQYRRLGRSGLQVSLLSFGSWVTYGNQTDESAAVEIMAAAYDAGVNFFDNAEAYSGGESERIMGEAIASLGWPRYSYVLSTKVFWGLHPDPNMRNTLNRKYLLQAIDGSLERLGLDFVDLLYCHRPDAETPLEETLCAFNGLVKEGKVRYIGASNYSGARLTEALETSHKNGIASYISLQPHYNLVERHDYESDLLPVVKKYQVGVIPYFSLAAGFLTGKYRSQQDTEKAARGAMVQKYLNDWGFAVVAALDEVAHDHGSTPGRVALAWLLAQPGITSPIASATNEKQLIDLVEAARLKLDAGSVQKLDEVSARKAAV